MNETGLKLRFEVLRGEAVSGNNNQEIIEELLYVIKELMSMNIISDNDGKELIQELN
jgi:hypothetical protein